MDTLVSGIQFHKNETKPKQTKISFKKNLLNHHRLVQCHVARIKWTMCDFEWLPFFLTFLSTAIIRFVSLDGRSAWPPSWPFSRTRPLFRHPQAETTMHPNQFRPRILSAALWLFRRLVISIRCRFLKHRVHEYDLAYLIFYKFACLGACYCVSFSRFRAVFIVF